MYKQENIAEKAREIKVNESPVLRTQKMDFYNFLILKNKKGVFG